MIGNLRVLACAIVVGAGAPAFAATAFENFDTNSDSRWEHLNNETAPQNYGWRAADNPANQSGSAALGGSFARVASPANFYGFNIGAHNPSTEGLTASGEVYIQGRDGGAGYNIGFFSGASSYGSGGDGRNAMVIGLADGQHAQAFLYDPTGGRDRSGVETTLATGAAYSFSMTWTPPPSGASEKGFFTTTVNGVTQTVSFSGNPFESITHFGVFTVSANGGTAMGFIDNVTFTSKNPIPEPASMGLLGLVGLAALRRRR